MKRYAPIQSPFATTENVRLAVTDHAHSATIGPAGRPIAASGSSHPAATNAISRAVTKVAGGSGRSGQAYHARRSAVPGHSSDAASRATTPRTIAARRPRVPAIAIA